MGNPSCWFSAKGAAVVATLLGTFAVARPATASDPATSAITVPSVPGQTVTVTWTGTIPPLTNGTSDCADLEDTPLVD